MSVRRSFVCGCRWIAAFTLFGCLFVPAVASAESEAAVPSFAPAGPSFLKRHCVKCHNDQDANAELSLAKFETSDSVVKQRKVWENVVRQVVAGTMPPENEPQPTVAEAEAFVNLVRAVFDHHDRTAKPDPGRVTMRRLNKVEYRNTIRDLVGVTFDPTEDFPSDDIGHGFDNIGDVLSLSPVLMERYLGAADSIMSQAIRPVLPAVIKRHLTTLYSEPASGDVAKKLMENGYRRISSDGTEGIEVGPINTPYMWEDDGDYIFRTKVYGRTEGQFPLRAVVLVFGKDLADASSDEELDRIVGKVMRPAKILGVFDVNATKREEAQVLEVRVPAMPGRHRMLVGLMQPAEGQPAAHLLVEYLALEGPLDTRPASQRQLLAARADASQAERSREVLERFVRRAYRRQPTDAELQRVLKMAEAALADGESWEAAMQFAMQAVLCSPKFLFRVEQDGDPRSEAIRPLDEYQLASRLSYFLWSSMPDDELLSLAGRGELSRQLPDQVRRMIADPKSSALVQNFALQWLQIQRLEFISPDAALFPTFNNDLRKALLTETELFVTSVIREDRSILDLIDADYTYVNEPLAKHYGIADTLGNRAGEKPAQPGGQPIRGPQFARVSLQGRDRGGLLTQGSVLTVTSNPTRTSPVKRGRWVLEQILGAPPPPPPPNVPELPEAAEAVAGGSLRERLEIHRQNPSCANCHAKMDPIGFALENFNAVGAFRLKDGDFEIDAAGEFADGQTFAGPAGLKDVVRERSDDFRRCLTEKLLIYALGRGLEYYDRPVVEKILRELKAGDDRFSVLLTQIALSDAFRQRRGLSE